MTTVLCIEADPRVVGPRKALLESKGYRVLVAPECTSGIEIIQVCPSAASKPLEQAASDTESTEDTLSHQVTELQKSKEVLGYSKQILDFLN